MDNATTVRHLINELTAEPTEPGSTADARAGRATVVPDVPPRCALTTDPTTRPVGIARQHALAVLQGDNLVEPALQVVSELVTNAVTHHPKDYKPQPGTAPPVILSIQIERRWILIAVRDPWPGMPIERDATAEDEDGRGLRIVRELAAARWTDIHGQGHKTVHALLLRPGAELSPGELWRLRHP